MPTLENLRRRLFWVVARTCFTLYRWFPLFGTLRASVAIIQRDQQFLMIERNDGRGVSLPGGLAGRKETAEEALRREVLEETGLRVPALELLLHYHSTADVPCDVSVFRVQSRAQSKVQSEVQSKVQSEVLSEAEATGELKSSWEGSPQWMTLAEIELRILESQRPVLEFFRQLSAATQPQSPPDSL